MTRKNNSKIISVVSDLFGKTGRNRIETLSDIDTGLKIEHVEQCAQVIMKVPESEKVAEVQFANIHSRN